MFPAFGGVMTLPLLKLKLCLNNLNYFPKYVVSRHKYTLAGYKYKLRVKWPEERDVGALLGSGLNMSQ